MPTSRSYQDACGIARALDMVGERWALLVVRELLLGPRRFTDLRRGLPGASSNLLADRLRELEGRDVIRRHRLAPPAASWVYELTAWGRELEPVVLALGGWGLGVPQPTGPTTLSATSVLLYLRGAARPDPRAPDSTVRVELDGDVWTVRAAGGEVRVEPGEPGQPGEPGGTGAADASIGTDPQTLNALLDDPSTLDDAVAAGTVRVEGRLPALRRLLGAVTPAPRRPRPAPPR